MILCLLILLPHSNACFRSWPLICWLHGVLRMANDRISWLFLPILMQIAWCFTMGLLAIWDTALTWPTFWPV
jgi:hypothetical protein